MPQGVRETIVETNSFSGSVQKSYKMGESSYGKYFDNDSGRWERWSGSGAPQVSISGGSIATTLAGTAVSGSVGITGSATLPVSLVGTAISGSVGITGSIGTSITGSIDLYVVSHSALPVSISTTTYNYLASLTNVSIAAGGATSFTPTYDYQKNILEAYAYIHPTNNGSGSLIVSGSGDNVNWFPAYESAVFNSGSIGISLNTKITQVFWFFYWGVWLRNLTTGSAISGSLYAMTHI